SKVFMDQPCCMFEPHVLALREGQGLEVKNSAAISHNVNVNGGLLGPNKNPILPPGKSLDLAPTELKARLMPIQISCSIHNWMKAYVFVFNHPYFAVTDEDGNFEIKGAPQGRYRLVVWQESVGWVIGAASPAKGGGKVIMIGNQTDVGKIPLKPESP